MALATLCRTGCVTSRTSTSRPAPGAGDEVSDAIGAAFCGPNGTTGIVISDKRREAFSALAGGGDPEDLVGGAILPLGWCNLSEAGAPFIRLPQELSHVAWLPRAVLERLGGH